MQSESAVRQAAACVCVHAGAHTICESQSSQPSNRGAQVSQLGLTERA